MEALHVHSSGELYDTPTCDAALSAEDATRALDDALSGLGRFIWGELARD